MPSEPDKRAPVQDRSGLIKSIPWEMHLRAYTAYCKKWGSQQALIEGGCRGGFALGELDDFIPGWRDELPELETLAAEVKRLRAEITRLSERVERAKGMLAEASEVLDRYSDASQEPGDSYPRPNAAMRMMHEINEELDRA